MRNILLFLFSSLLLVSCVASSGTPSDISGAWVDEQERLYFLDEDGTLGMPGQTALSGVRWTLENDVLTLSTMDSPGGDVRKRKLILKQARSGSMEFIDADGSTVTWKKSRATVGRLEGSLFYRERMALPPKVVISVQLYPLHSPIPVATSITPVAGGSRLPFRVYYLEQTVTGQVRLAASVLHSGETLFATQNDEIIDVPSSPNVLLYRSMPGERQLPPLKTPASYEGALKISGKNVTVRLYLEDDGLALLTQDGDRNQYMGTWMEKDRNRTIEITRGALKPVTATREAGGGLLLNGLSAQPVDLKPAEIPWPSKGFLLEGELRSLNGKPVFSECNSQRDIPIQPSGKGYDQLSQVLQSNGESSVVLEGRLQGGRLEASNVFLVRKGGVCSTENYASAPLLQTYWRLRELNGAPVELFPEQPEPHLVLRDNGQASGSDGCNNFFMNWKRKDEAISFSDGGSTLRMCPQGEEQARAMHTMFSKADEWNINGSMLELRSKKSIVAVFEAVDM
ncbi:META domain-containing protein [Mailhella sp.]|uniref:META domain-containing protein n=1 Tax=Mailhella sp. TaxID=1981029 RepID=UPI003AB7144E